MTQYVGRFAPSPSGPLHFGSLVTALGSYLQAKVNDGKWLLRIEDIDPPREVAGASDSILRCLEAHHLFWDDKVTYQSQRSDLYRTKIEYLFEHDHVYCCACTRVQLSNVTPQKICDCVNKDLPEFNCAIRFKHLFPAKSFHDKLLGQIDFKPKDIAAQFAVRRKDGLFAYQLAVVVDDIQQGITEVARGADLLSATVFQLALYKAFACPVPDFIHFPVVVSASGKKLSKQNHATAIDNRRPEENLVSALQFLGLPVSATLHQESPQNILNWAISNWDTSKLEATTECIDNRIGQEDRI